MKWHYMVVLICISLFTNKVKQVFLCFVVHLWRFFCGMLFSSFAQLFPIELSFLAFYFDAQKFFFFFNWNAGELFSLLSGLFFQNKVIKLTTFSPYSSKVCFLLVEWPQIETLSQIKPCADPKFSCLSFSIFVTHSSKRMEEYKSINIC